MRRDKKQLRSELSTMYLLLQSRSFIYNVYNSYFLRIKARRWTSFLLAVPRNRPNKPTEDTFECSFNPRIVTGDCSCQQHILVLKLSTEAFNIRKVMAGRQVHASRHSWTEGFFLERFLLIFHPCILLIPVTGSYSHNLAYETGQHGRKSKRCSSKDHR